MEIRVVGRGEGTYSARGSVMFFKAPAERDDGDFSLMERTLPPGGRRPPAHRHTNCSEGYFVLDGLVSAVVEGDELAMGPDPFLLVPRRTAHTFGNAGRMKPGCWSSVHRRWMPTSPGSTSCGTGGSPRRRMRNGPRWAGSGWNLQSDGGQRGRSGSPGRLTSVPGGCKGYGRLKSSRAAEARRPAGYELGHEDPTGHDARRCPSVRPTTGAGTPGTAGSAPCCRCPCPTRQGSGCRGTSSSGNSTPVCGSPSRRPRKRGQTADPTIALAPTVTTPIGPGKSTVRHPDGTLSHTAHRDAGSNRHDGRGAVRPVRMPRAGGGSGSSALGSRVDGPAGAA